MKRLIALFVLLCTTLSFTTVAYAQKNDNQGNETKSLDYIVEDWIDTQYQGNAEVSQVVILKNTSNQCVGHLVTFNKASKPAGYIVLSHQEEDYPIIEFAFDGESVYEYLEEQIETNRETLNRNLKQKSSTYTIASQNVLYTDFINYSLKVQDDKDDVLLFDQNGQTTVFSDTSSDIMPYSDTFWDDYYNYPPEGSSAEHTGNYLSAAIWSGAVKMSDMASGEGNCGPTSLTDVIKIYACDYIVSTGVELNYTGLRINNSNKDTYNRLVELSGYSCSEPASMSELISGLKAYVKERQYNCSVGNYWFDFWSDFTRDVDNRKPILLYTSSSAGSAHAQVVVGYYTFTNSNTNESTRYLLIHSGWRSTPSYLKFKPSSLNHFNGYCVTISK